MASKKKKKKSAKKKAKASKGSAKCTVCRKAGHNARSHRAGAKKQLA